jgi:hypothetical protein
MTPHRPAEDWIDMLRRKKQSSQTFTNKKQPVTKWKNKENITKNKITARRHCDDSLHGKLRNNNMTDDRHEHRRANTGQNQTDTE